MKIAGAIWPTIFIFALMGQYQIENLLPFVRFKTSRSGGSGGQHVNKVSTKVELLFDLESATLFTDEEKGKLHKKLRARFQSDGFIQLVVQESRSQLENKEIALKKLASLLAEALKTEKRRKPTKPGKAAIQARLDAKRKQALKKINRRSLE